MEKDASIFVDFVNNLIAKKAKVNIYLISGIKLVGTIVSADEKSVILESTNQLVRVSAISTISEITVK